MNIGHLKEFVSFLTMLKVAMHGVYNKVITIYDKAVSGVKCIFIEFINIVPSSAYCPAYSIPRVPTTASLAGMPANKATDSCQLPNPVGLKIGKNQ